MDVDERYKRADFFIGDVLDALYMTHCTDDEMFKMFQWLTRCSVFE